MTDNTDALPPLPEPSAYEVFAYGRRERLVSRADVADELACKYRENDPTADFSGLYTAKQVREAQRAALAAQQGAQVPWDVRKSAEFTREDLGPTGKNYPHVRALLGFVESLMQSSSASPQAPAQPSAAAPSAQAEPQVPLTDEQIDSLRGLDTASRVRFYEHDFYVLSNFSAFNLRWKGNTFPTSEHAYHWEKFAGYWDATNAAGNIATQVLNAPSAHQAFKIAEGCKARRRPDWDDVKVGIMLDILREKAKQHEYVRRKLLATGDRELVEDSWRDDFWGWGPNRDGKNMLGKLWMQVRAELRGIGKQESK